VPSKTAALHCRAGEAQRVAGGSCGRSRRHQAFERAVEMVGDDVVHGEYNVDTSLYTGLGNNIDGRRLQLDQIHIRLYAREIFAQARAIREVRRNGDDVRVEVRGRRGTGGEHRNASSGELRERTQTKSCGDDRDVLDRPDPFHRGIAENDDEIGDEHAIGVEVRGRILAGADDEDATVDVDRRNCRAATVEDHEIRT